MIYVPNAEDYKCIVVRDSQTIRAYKENPTYNSTINYTDYYIHSDYLSNNGYQTFNQYSTLPICLANSLLTDSYVYRVDFQNILLIFLLMLIIIAYPSFYLIKRIFRGKKAY